MMHYVKEKKRNKLCTFPIYSIIILFIFIQFSFQIVLVKLLSIYLLSILFMFISPEDQCNAFLDAVYFCISVNDCHLNLKALLGQEVFRLRLATALIKDILL